MLPVIFGGLSLAVWTRNTDLTTLLIGETTFFGEKHAQPSFDKLFILNYNYRIFFLFGVNKASNFEELKEILNIRSEFVPSCYFDRLFLENDKPISRILEEDWWPYAETIGDNHFPSINKVKTHIRFREDRGWQYESSGNPTDPIVRLVGFDPSTKRLKMKQ
jgi:hypothetical protein